MRSDKIKAIITGGSTGIGYGIAKHIKSRQGKVFICARTDKDLELAKESLQVPGVAADVSLEEDVERLFHLAELSMGGINTVINNAGIAYLAPLIEMELASLQKVLDVNLIGAFLVGKAAARYFIKNGVKGNIINVASTAAQKGFETGTAYCASKFALAGMTECWRSELRRHDIRVMQINPSEVITPFILKLGQTPVHPEKKLQADHIAQVVTSMLEMDEVGFIPEVTVWATNPK